jgi:hypothetical protein
VGYANSYTFWDPDLAPTSPSAYDDEFSVAGLNVKWTTVNWGTLAATDVNTTVPGCLYAKTNSGGSTNPGIVQALPAGDFTIFMKVRQYSMDTASAQNSGFGLVLSTSNTTGAGTQTHYWYALVGSGRELATTQNQSSWTAAVVQGTPIPAGVGTILYIRVRRSGANYFYGWSSDGIFWTEGASTPNGVPAYMGISFYHGSASTNHWATEFFRYFPSASAVLGGNRTVLTT